MVDRTLREICQQCGKPITSGRAPGSLTAFLFSASSCSCARDGGAPLPGRRTDSSDDAVDFCPKCGLQKVTNVRDGSLTGFLFQSTRCKCAPDKDFADGRMSDKFWKLKQSEAGTTFTNAPVESAKTSEMSIDLAPGATIGGVYQIVELIGRGGMGEVYLARHTGLGKKCALKVIPPEQVTEIGWQRFQQEAKAVARLDHINLVRVTDLGIHEGCLPYYAMDYVQGKNLSELVHEHGPMPLKTMLEIFIQVCDGVECAHRSGILHRDLKPANIMLVDSKTGMKQAKILDFGLAKLTKQDRNRQSLTAMGDVFGSPFYMSPEQCKGEKLDNRSDIYSIGCSMFECLTGRPPFTGNLASTVIFSQLEADPPSLASALPTAKFPSAMEIVMAKLLRKNPAERYHTLSQVRADLGLVLEGREVLPVYVAREHRSFEPAPPAVVAQGGELAAGANSLNRAFVGSLIIGSIILISAAGFYFWKQNTGGQTAFHAQQAPKQQQQSPVSRSKLNDTPADLVLPDLESNSVNDSILNVKLTSARYFSRPVTVDGKEFVEFDFPKLAPSQNIGWFLIGADRIRLDGKVRVAKGTKLTLSLYPNASKIPQFFEKFRPGEITGLYLGSSFFTDDDAEQALKLPGFTDLTFYNCTELTDKIAPAVNDLELKQLYASICPIKPALISKAHFWKKLTVLDFSNNGNITPVLKEISGSKNLEYLDISYSRLTPVDFQLIAKIPNIRRLSLAENKMTMQDLHAIAALPNLTSLNLFNVRVTDGSLYAVISEFHALQELNVRTGSMTIKDKLLVNGHWPPHLRISNFNGKVASP